MWSRPRGSRIASAVPDAAAASLRGAEEPRRSQLTRAVVEIAQQRARLAEPGTQRLDALQLVRDPRQRALGLVRQLRQPGLACLELRAQHACETVDLLRERPQLRLGHGSIAEHLA